MAYFLPLPLFLGSSPFAIPYTARGEENSAKAKAPRSWKLFSLASSRVQCTVGTSSVTRFHSTLSSSLASWLRCVQRSDESPCLLEHAAESVVGTLGAEARDRYRARDSTVLLMTRRIIDSQIELWEKANAHARASCDDYKCTARLDSLGASISLSLSLSLSRRRQISYFIPI